MKWLEKLSYRWLFRIVIFWVLLGAVLYTLQSDIFSIKHIVMEGRGDQRVYKMLEPDLIEKARPLMSKNLWKAPMNEVAQELLQIPGVKSVVVERKIPNTILVQVVPQKIAFNAWINSEKILPVTEQAQVLPKITAKLAPDAPIVRDRRLMRSQKLREKTVELINQLPEEGSFSHRTLNEIEYSKGNFWLSVVNSDVRIKIHPENAEVKSLRVGRVLEYIEKNKLNARVIDADYSKKVVVKLRKGR